MDLLIDASAALIDGALRPATLHLAEGRIARLDAQATGARRIDAAGLLVLPGIVDLHGDGFERQIQPRPGVTFPLPAAVADTEAQLLANGITTAWHAVTLSWEPGLRSPDTWSGFLAALEAHPARADMRVHMRWEQHNLDALDLAVADIEAGRVHLLSFNDHTPEIVKKLDRPAAAAKYSERAMVPVNAFRALAEQAADRTPYVPAASARIAAAARAAGIPIASHDEATIAARAAYRALGATICEFPMAEPVAQNARAAGETVVMGAPNVVRGGSHLGWASAQSLAERGLCTVLCSDYYYPALPAAALRLAQGPLGLPAAWDLVSQNPARAAGLTDRGHIAEGARADLVLLDPATARVVMTIARGQIGWIGPHAWDRIS